MAKYPVFARFVTQCAHACTRRSHFYDENPFILKDGPDIKTGPTYPRAQHLLLCFWREKLCRKLSVELQCRCMTNELSVTEVSPVAGFLAQSISMGVARIDTIMIKFYSKNIGTIWSYLTTYRYCEANLHLLCYICVFNIANDNKTRTMAHR